MFSDDFKRNRGWLIRINMINISSGIGDDHQVPYLA